MREFWNLITESFVLRHDILLWGVAMFLSYMIGLLVSSNLFGNLLFCGIWLGVGLWLKPRDYSLSPEEMKVTTKKLQVLAVAFVISTIILLLGI